MDLIHGLSLGLLPLQHVILDAGIEKSYVVARRIGNLVSEPRLAQ